MAAAAIRYSLAGSAALICLDSPPVNALSRLLRRELSLAIQRAADDPQVRAVIICGAGKTFCGGASLADVGTDGLAEPSLQPTITEQIESLDKPVIAAIHGAAVGGGLELALACHYRIATPDAKLGLPEITLGFIPGAGGTQRLPRALGLERALNMILSGRSRPARDFAATALIDRLIDGDLLEAAAAFARDSMSIRPLPRLRDRKVVHPDAAALLQFARRAAASNRRSPPGAMAAIDAVARTLEGRFEDGTQFERERFQMLAGSAPARALRYGFLGKAAARKADGIGAGVQPRSIQNAVVIGAGLMGSGIAICLAEAGIAVTLSDNSAAGLERGRAAVARHFEAQFTAGKLSAEQRARCSSLVSCSADHAAIENADLIIEAVYESLEVKTAVFVAMNTHARPGAILASNTSSLNLDELASSTSRPQDVLGLHFFSPAQVMPLLEIVRGARTADDVLAAALSLAGRLRKTAVIAGVGEGFIGNRMIDRYTAQAFAMLVEGALPEQIDAALEDFGMAMGPFRMLDLVGNDLPWAVRKRQYATRPDVVEALAADALCERGWFGQKTGSGWYRHAAGEKRPLPNPAIAPMLEEISARLGIAREKKPAQEIVQRCLLALVNEGARLLEEGVAQRASDIDVVQVAGYGFPAWRGGPMFQADELGLDTVIRQMRHFAARDSRHAAFWEPAALLLRLADAGGPLQAAVRPQDLSVRPHA